MDIEEEALIQAAQEGQEAAFEELYIHHREAIANLAFRYVGNYQDAEELLQDIFIKSFLAIKRFRPLPDASFFSWIYRIGINCAINFVRKREARLFRSGSQIRGIDIEAMRASNPETKRVNAEIREAFYEAMEGLSPTQRMIFVLKNSDQMSTTEVAAYLNCSEGSVRKQWHRAVVKMRRALTLYREEGS